MAAATARPLMLAATLRSFLRSFLLPELWLWITMVFPVLFQEMSRQHAGAGGSSAALAAVFGEDDAELLNRVALRLLQAIAVWHWVQPYRNPAAPRPFQFKFALAADTLSAGVGSSSWLQCTGRHSPTTRARRPAAPAVLATHAGGIAAAAVEPYAVRLAQAGGNPYLPVELQARLGAMRARALANLELEQQHSNRLHRTPTALPVNLLSAAELLELLADGGGNNAGAAHADGPNASPNVRLMPTYELYLLAAAGTGGQAVTAALRLSLVGLDAARQLRGAITTRERNHLLQVYCTTPPPSPKVLCTKEGCLGHLQQLTNGPRRAAKGVVEAGTSMLEVFTKQRALLSGMLAHPTSNKGDGRTEAAARTVCNLVVLSHLLLALHAGLQHSQTPAIGGSASNPSAPQVEGRGVRAGTSPARQQCMPPPTKRLRHLVY